MQLEDYNYIEEPKCFNSPMKLDGVSRYANTDRKLTIHRQSRSQLQSTGKKSELDQ